MTLFRPATNQSAYLKAGILGFQGSGKTYTAVQIAIGLHRYIKSTKPIGFLDTETGSDWALPVFAKAGIELQVAKTKAFKDLVAGIPEAEKSCDILIVDSVSHFWTELMEAYKRSHRIPPDGRIPFHHWMPIKMEWGKFSEEFVNSRLHIIVCGRAGWEYDYEEDEEGKKDLIKTGTKMRAEGEFGYEPSLLIEMERVRETATLEGKPVGKIGAKVIHLAHVIKDRNMDAAASLDGKCFENPTFEEFLPHVRGLALGGEQLGVDTTRRSDDYLASPTESRAEMHRLRQVALEEIEETMKTIWPGGTGGDKVVKNKVADILFGTKSWTQIQGLPLEKLTAAAKTLRILEQQGESPGADKVEAALAEVASLSPKAKIEEEVQKALIDSSPIREDEVPGKETPQ